MKLECGNCKKIGRIIELDKGIYKCVYCQELNQVPGVQRQEGHNHVEEKLSNDIKIWDWTNIQENAGFNYSDYLKSILSLLKKDDFGTLSASQQTELTYDKAVELGLLTNSDVNKLRIILRDGFKKNKDMQEIQSQIKEYIPLKDRFTLKEDGTKTLALSADARPEIIARTETLRLANEGLIKTYEDNNVKKVSWLATLSERTCDVCMQLDGQIMTNEQYLSQREQIHPCCRCSCLALTEQD